MGVLLGISSRRCFEVHRLSPGFVGSVRPTFGGVACVGAGRRPGGSWCFGWGGRRGFVEDFPASFRVLFEELVARVEVEAAVLAASGGEVVPPP